MTDETKCQECYHKGKLIKDKDKTINELRDRVWLLEQDGKRRTDGDKDKRITELEQTIISMAVMSGRSAK